ncbi:MAG TPA: nicotinate-nucleotide adenylyltransferase [Caldilineae bacterium]|nr:nicotinate-nucleotide adenylyltransferase [Caldilineae bacterium]
MRIGILGGTFDPPHIGHLILAEEAWSQLNLDRVLLVPAGDPPHKRGQPLSPAYHRVRMVELAIADNPHLELSRVDVDRPGPHYTIDMVHILREQFSNDDVELFFLMGLDSLADLPHWHRAADLVATCRLVALSRPDVYLDWEYLEASLPGIRDRVILLDMPELEIASHVLQQRVRQGRPIRYQVLPAVEEYIYRHNLYRDPSTTQSISSSVSPTSAERR